MNKWGVGALAVMLLALGCAKAIPHHDYASEPDPRRGEYVIGVADVLSIQVWRNDEISSEVTVRPDGTITLPLLGDIHAAGMTPSQLREEVTERLHKWLRTEGAVVTVAVVKVNSYRFTVSGEVTNTGVFTSDHYLTVADAIALAGGFTRYAERGNVMILRRDKKGGPLRKIPIDFRALATGNHNEMNIALMPGDMIVVP